MNRPALSFLVSTLGERPEALDLLLQDLAAQANGDLEVVVVLQARDEAVTDVVREVLDRHRDHLAIDLVESETIGLSTSRNIALGRATGEILVLADDDCRYPPSATRDVTECFSRHSDWQVATFRMEDDDGELKKSYPDGGDTLGQMGVMHVSSVEVALRREVVSEQGVLFDERVGLGTPYPTGAENIMLIDCLREGYEIGHCARTIVRHGEPSSGSVPADRRQLLRAKAVMFHRMFGFPGAALAVWFFLRRLLPDRQLRFRLEDFPALVEGLQTRL